MRLIAMTFLLTTALALSACGQQVETSTAVSLQLPERLHCAAPPQNIKARLWITGITDPCPLEVSNDGTVSGACPKITARASRSCTLDYYIEQDISLDYPELDSPYTVLLAQTKKEIELSGVEESTYDLVFTDADFVSEDSCLDFTHINEDGDMGSSVVTDFDDKGKPCDLDGDMQNNSGGSNLQELCAGSDPFITDTP